MNEGKGGGPGFWRRNVWPTMAAVLMVVTATGGTLTWTSQQRALDRQQDEVSHLQEQIGQAERETAERTREDVMSSVGIDQARVSRDGQDIRGLVEIVFTWDSGESYEAARDSAARRFGLADDGQFLTAFMPPAAYTQNSDGTRFYEIDTLGTNVTVEDSARVEVAGVSAGEYTYAVMVDTRVTSDMDPSVRTTRTALLMATYDADGQLVDLTGIAPHGSTAYSG